MAISPIAGKTCMVTGANGGIGKEISLCLAAAGAELILICRDQARGRTVLDEVKGITGKGKAELLICDLSSMESIRTLAKEFAQSHDHLNLLVNTAAVFVRKRVVTKEGYELMFATNYLGQFLLTNLLLDSLKAGAPSRIVNLSAPSTTKLDFDDLQYEKKFGALHAFGASKTADLLYTYELARQLEGTGVTANVFFPGVSKTGLMKDAPSFVRLFARLIAKNPKIPAKAACYVSTSAQMEGVTGKFFKGTELSHSSAYSTDPSVQRKLWEVSVRLTGLA